MKSLVFLFMLIGFVFIAIGFIKTNQQCPPPIIQFRYIPKTFNEEQNSQVPLTSIFGKMFNDSSPWQQSVSLSTQDEQNNNNVKPNNI